VTQQPCDIRAVASQLANLPAHPPLNVSAMHVLSVQTDRNTGAVELGAPDPYYVRLAHVHGTWIVDEDACLWIAEVSGGDLPGSVTKGLRLLAANDPRRIPAAALISSFVGGFNAKSFLSAFDPTNQPCDVRALADELDNQGSSDGPSPSQIRYFMRDMGSSRVGVFASFDGTALPLRVREIDHRWLLDENACSWLTLMISAKHRAQDVAVQSDVRNAMTAEQTYYTDSQIYSASPADMKPIEPSLDWGNRLQVTVADAVTPGDASIVCLSESSATGNTYSIASVAAGPNAGIYYGPKSCPGRLTADSAAKLGHTFDTTPGA
jgi:hypothetical protein